ncbi:hypothetical protein N7509_012992 [Penicillium cosmopolitanum]|uniref:Uncharacterized protein n=1 Tax=Penicillium cosmopolitanum TaxID=1131564 RepID=A0A9W9VE66_9EURO|nr:uncharacterized protein N7509_012992 [Penicillium cosmopolitanum]KAJ5376106.1 hypothetical protein N7509_012992 [Penicillium cosmopolitanum]
MALGEIIFLRGQERRDGVTVTEVEEVAFGTARHRSGEAGKSWTIRRPLLKYAEDLFAREFMNGFEDTVISFFEKSVRAQKTFGHQRMNGTNKQGVYIHLIIHTLLQKLLAGYGGSSDDVDRRNNTQHSWPPKKAGVTTFFLNCRASDIESRIRFLFAAFEPELPSSFLFFLRESCACGSV